MDHSVRRTARHHHSQTRPPAHPLSATVQPPLASSSSATTPIASKGALSPRVAHPSNDTGLSSSSLHDHGMEALIDSLPEAVLREVLKSVAHLSTIQEALSSVSTPSTPILGPSPARSGPVLEERRAAHGVISDFMTGQNSRHSSMSSTAEPTASPIATATMSRVTKRAASLSPTRSSDDALEEEGYRRRPVVKKPTLADATPATAVPFSMMQHRSHSLREPSPHRHFSRHTEVRRGYLRQTTPTRGTSSSRESSGTHSSLLAAAAAAGSDVDVRDSMSQQQLVMLAKIRKGLLQYIHRANLYYHGTLETKDAVISLLNIANFALDPNAQLIKSPTTAAGTRQHPRRPTATMVSLSPSSHTGEPTAMQQQTTTATGTVTGADPLHHQHTYTRRPVSYQQHQYQHQQPSPMTPQLSRAGTQTSSTSASSSSVTRSPLLRPTDQLQQRPIRGSTPISSGGRTSLLPTPHASPSISSASPGFAGSSRRAHLDDAMTLSRISADRRSDGLGPFSSVPAPALTSITVQSTIAPETSAPMTQASSPQGHRLQRGVVPISHEILSSLTMILLRHPGQKQRALTDTAIHDSSMESTDQVAEATEDGCDLEDWLLEAVYNLLEHETYKGQPMAEALSEYIVQVALSRERRYRNLRLQYEHQHNQQPHPQQIHQHSKQDQDEEQLLEDEGDIHEDIEDKEEKHGEEDEVLDQRQFNDDSDEEQHEQTTEEEKEKIHSLSLPDAEDQDEEQVETQRNFSVKHRPLTLPYPLNNHARFRWATGIDGSSDIGDISTSDMMAIIPSEPPSDLATDLPASEPPTELGEPIKLVMLSEDCFGTMAVVAPTPPPPFEVPEEGERSYPGDDSGGLANTGNDSFRQHREGFDQNEDDDDEEEDGINTFILDAIDQDIEVPSPGRLMDRSGVNNTTLGDDDDDGVGGVVGEPPSDLPSEVHDISRIDLASDLEPLLLQEMARDALAGKEDVEHLYPME